MGVIGGAPGAVFSTAPASGAVGPPRPAGVRRPGRPPGGSLAAPRLHLNAVEVSGKGHCARQRCRGTVVPPRSAGATPRAPSRGVLRLRRRECGVVGRTAGSLHGRLLPRTDVVAVVVPLTDAVRMTLTVVPTPVRPPGARRRGWGGRAGPGGPGLAAGQGLQRGALRLRRPGRRGLRAQRRLGGRHARVTRGRAPLRPPRPPPRTPPVPVYDPPCVGAGSRGRCSRGSGSRASARRPRSSGPISSAPGSAATRGRAPPASQASTSYSTWYLVRFTWLGDGSRGCEAKLAAPGWEVGGRRRRCSGDPGALIGFP